jgi:hypothetical protein
MPKSRYKRRVRFIQNQGFQADQKTDRLGFKKWEAREQKIENQNILTEYLISSDYSVENHNSITHYLASHSPATKNKKISFSKKSS